MKPSRIAVLERVVLVVSLGLIVAGVAAFEWRLGLIVAGIAGVLVAFDSRLVG
jgi:hypothetical protein